MRAAGFGALALSGRYVNDTGKPVDDLSQDPNKEFRMMPIDMRLVIEQKAIPRLLVEVTELEHEDRRPLGADSRREAGSVRTQAAAARGPTPGPATGASPVSGMGRSIPGRGGNFLQRNAGTATARRRLRPGRR